MQEEGRRSFEESAPTRAVCEHAYSICVTAMCTTPCQCPGILLQTIQVGHVGVFGKLMRRAAFAELPLATALPCRPEKTGTHVAAAVGLVLDPVNTVDRQGKKRKKLLVHAA